MARYQPEIGSWFENIESGDLFEVVAIDELHETIEVQYFDGTLDEFELQTWKQMPVITAAPPEDANAAYEMMPEEIQDDPENYSSGSSPYNTRDALDQIEGGMFAGTDPRGADE